MEKKAKGMMKKLTNQRGLLALAGLFLVAVLVTGSSVAAERGEFAVLVRARGRVEVQLAGTTKWETASERMRVNRGDSVKVGPGGEAVLRISDRNYVVVSENGQFTLNAAGVRTVTDPNNSFMGLFPARTQALDAEVDLQRGRAVSVMRGLRGQSQYRLRTPIATAAVRGTVFMGEIVEPGRGNKQTGTGQVNFACSEGMLRINSNRPDGFSPITLNEGQFLTFALLAGALGSAGPIPPEVLQLLEATVNQIQFQTDQDNQLQDVNPLIQQRQSSGYYY